jgi:hypothetical protein
MLTYITIFDEGTEQMIKKFESILAPKGHHLILCCASESECINIEKKPWLKLKIKKHN